LLPLFLRHLLPVPAEPFAGKERATNTQNADEQCRRGWAPIREHAFIMPIGAAPLAVVRTVRTPDVRGPPRRTAVRERQGLMTP